MEWIRENWFFLLFSILFIAMHLFGHGMHGMRCGGHGEHEGHSGQGAKKGEHEGHGESDEKEEEKGGHGCC